MPDRRRFIAAALALGLPIDGRAWAQGGPIVAPVRLEGGRILVEARLNGQGPFAFAIDTGAELNGVKQAVATRAGLRKVRDVKLNGGRTFPLYAVDELLLGGAVRQAGAALFGLPGERLGADGLIAAGMLTSFDSELDLERGQWRVWPTGSPDRTGFTKLESSLREPEVAGLSRRIFARAELGEERLKPLLDTGSSFMLTLDYTIGRRLGLWSDSQPYSPFRGSGPTGPSKSLARLVRGQPIQIGPNRYDAPLVAIRPKDANGPDAMLGLALLRTLDLSIDRAEGAVWVRRNSLQPERRTYGGSGLWVEDGPGGVTVADVGIGSPAAKAGVRVGDGLEGLDLRSAIAKLGRPYGQSVSLTLRREGQSIPVNFVLADYL